jgi:hypothetical protein
MDCLFYLSTMHCSTKAVIDKILKNRMWDWRSGSSGGAPALQEQSPEFKPQSYQKKWNVFQ